MTAPHDAASERAASNCGFYPACYIAGDCPHEGWKTGNCGLPAAEKQRRHVDWVASIHLTAMRDELAKHYRHRIHSGEFDHEIDARLDHHQPTTGREGE